MLSQVARPGQSLTLVSSFYTAALERPFAQALATAGSQLTVACIPYNQLHTFLLDPGSAIPDNTPATVILLLRVEDLIRLELIDLGPTPEASEACLRVFRERTEQFLEVLGRMTRLQLGLLICPSGRGAYDSTFLGNASRVAEHKIAAELRRQQRHMVLDWSEFESSTTSINCFNPSADRLGHVPFSPEGLDALAHFLVGKLDQIPSTILTPRVGGKGADLGRFLSSLAVQMTVTPLTSGDEQRVLDVVRHTTHFINLPNRKWEPNISATAASVPSGEAWAVRVRDRFGDYGVSGAVTFGVEEQVMRLGLLFLTCPVLGKQVEYALMAWLADVAEQVGAESIEVPFVPGRDNHGLQTLLARLGRESTVPERSSSERSFSIPVAGLADKVTTEAPDPASARVIFSKAGGQYPLSA